METQAGFCSFGCGRRVNPEQDYRKVTGWERHRNQGGTNALRLRQPHQGTESWACRFCIDRAANGIAPSQESLLA